MIASRPPAAPILPLTSVRFLAAFYVVLHHSNMWRWHMDSSTFLGRFLRSGHIAVGFFFVLSGFILAFVYLDTDRPFVRGKFWLARFARAYPLLLFSVLVGVPAYLVQQTRFFGFHDAFKNTLVSVVGSVMLLQAWAARFREINAPAWSLSTEAFFYLLFPFVAFWIWRRRGARALLLLFLFWGLSVVVPILVTHHDPSLFLQQSDTRARLQLWIQLGPIFRIFEFFSGISLCALHHSLVTRYTAAQRSRFAHFSFAAAAAIFLLVVAFAAHIPVMILNNGILLPAFLLLIYALTNAQGPLAHFFSHKWFVILGESSYALYLLHSPIFTYFDHTWRITSALPWFLYVAILFIASLATFYGLERPIRKKILAFAAQRPRVLIDQEAVAPN